MGSVRESLLKNDVNLYYDQLQQRTKFAPYLPTKTATLAVRPRICQLYPLQTPPQIVILS